MSKNQPGSSTGNQPGNSKGTKKNFHSTMGKGARFQILESAENSDSESEDHLPLSTTTLVAKQTSGRVNGGEDGQGTSSGERDQVQPEVITVRPSNEETAKEHTLACETGIENDRGRANTEGTEQQETEREPEHIPVTGRKKRGRKQRLVSYSSQDSASSLDETSSRRSGRKRTAVTKMGGVMIDNIRKTDKAGAVEENE